MPAVTKNGFFSFFITRAHFNALQSDFEISENKNEKIFKNMLDVSGGFMYTLPRTPLRGGSKE